MTPKIKPQNGSIATCMAVIIAMCMTILVVGCTSTELVDDSHPTEAKGQTITLNISCPEAAASTRADNDLHAGHVLRYSAILYSGGELRTGKEFERQEAIVSAEENKRFTFKVPEETYSCVVFADYIPSDSEPNSDGLYGNKYYNVTDPRERIYMRSFIDFSTFANGNQRVDERCFNNENYDCFAYIEENIKKEADEKIVDIKLERIVSRVAFKSTTDIPENDAVKNITFTKFDFFGTHTIKDGSINNSHHAGSMGSMGLDLSDFTLDSHINNSSDELFYFYTFASKKEDKNLYLLDFNFTVNFESGNKYEYTVPQAKIKPTPNYKIYVTGPFLSAPIVTVGDLILDIPSFDIETWKGETSVTLEEE